MFPLPLPFLLWLDGEDQIDVWKGMPEGGNGKFRVKVTCLNARVQYRESVVVWLFVRADTHSPMEAEHTPLLLISSSDAGGGPLGA